MLPRELRVSRCKAPHKTARAMEARMGKSTPFADRNKGNGKKFDRTKRGKPDAGSGGATGKYVPKPTAESQTLAGRASKLLGRFGAAQLVGKPPHGGSKGNAQKRLDRKERFTNRGGGGGVEAAAAGERSSIKGPEQFVFEGRRASARDGKPKDLKFKKGKAKPKERTHKKKNTSKYGK